MDRKTAERVIRLAQAEVPFSFLEQSMRKLVIGITEAINELPEKEREEYLKREFQTGDPEILKLIERYLLNPPVGNFPDIRGKRWSHSQAQKLVAEYWEKIKEYSQKDGKFKTYLEQMLLDVVDDIKFESNFEIILVVSLRSDPYTLRSSKLPLLAILLLVGIDLKDIGQTKDPSALKRVLEWYLRNQKMITAWEEVKNSLSKVLQDSGKRTKRME